MSELNSIRELRKTYTKELYSPDFTKDLLLKLYEFINSDLVEEKEWFSKYDKAALLVAYELLSKEENKRLPINKRKVSLTSPKTQDLFERSERAIEKLKSELLR